MNPFSLLDIAVPSPSLSVSSPSKYAHGLDSSARYADPHRIEFASNSGSPTPPLTPEDAWACLLQQESVVTQSRRPVSPSREAVERPTVKFPLSEDVEGTCGTSNSSTDRLNAFGIHIPSPLLCHKRSEAKSSDPTNDQLSDFTPPGSAIGRGLTADTCAVGSQEMLRDTQNASESAFNAARPPFMCDFLPPDEFVGESSVSESDSLPACLNGKCTANTATTNTPPALTTANTYIFPKKVYHVYCQPDAAWSGPSFSDVRSSWQFNRSPVSPKLPPARKKTHSRANPVPPGVRACKALVVQQFSGPAGICMGQMDHSLPAIMPSTNASSCRASTEGSLDTRFHVGTATKSSELRPASELHKTDIAKEGAVSCSDQGAEDNSCKAEDSEAGQFSWTRSMMERLFSGGKSHSSETMLEIAITEKASGKDTRCGPEQDMLSNLQVTNRLTGESSGASDDIWFDSHAPYSQQKIIEGSGVQFNFGDASSEQDDWEWDDEDEWETATTSSMTEVGTEVGSEFSGCQNF